MNSIAIKNTEQDKMLSGFYNVSMNITDETNCTETEVFLPVSGEMSTLTPLPSFDSASNCSSQMVEENDGINNGEWSYISSVPSVITSSTTNVISQENEIVVDRATGKVQSFLCIFLLFVLMY